jgi:hypothetical protein
VEARWEFLQAQAKQSDIGKTVDLAMEAIEKENTKRLKGILPKVYGQQKLDQKSLGGLIDLIGSMKNMASAEAIAQDLLGQVYEYFLGQFALAEGKKGGQFYTPESIVRLLVEILEPYNGRVFDPCCGSGGMFVQSEKFVRNHQGRLDNLSIYGQESNETTYKLCRMNLALRGIDGSNIRWNPEGSFLNDAHKDLKADFIIANPPFNDSDWSGETLQGDGRWQYGKPPAGNANFAWVQHFLYHLSPTGAAGFVLSNGSLSSNTSGEGEIRKKLVMEDLVDCVVMLPTQLFYNKQNETLEEIARSIFKHWFIDFEFLNADGKPYKSSGGVMVRSELGNIPEGWRVSTIGSEVETVGGGTPSTSEATFWENGDIPWYSPTDLTRSKTLFSIDSEKKITKLGLQKSSARLFSKYSLLLTSRATIGEVAISTKDACTNQGFITIIPNLKFSVYFLYGWLSTKIPTIKLLASGSTFPEISKSNFRGLDFVVPSGQILKDHEILISPIYKKIENNIFQIQSLTKTRDTLLPKLMSGQLCVEV